MGSWNYPYVVTLKPLAQAIAAGYCVMIKPSEMSPASTKIIKSLVENYLDPECYSVIEGGPEVACAITQFKFDMICFTGSTDKGRLVA